MKLRNIKGDYNIGLDIGTASVGWAVTGEDGKLLYASNKPAWGSRLFDSAETAASARIPRSQRRRYIRRRWRLDLLQGLLQDEIEKVDPEFFLRLRQSRLVKDDPNKTTSSYKWPLFNDKDFTEVDYYKQFPTIYHLREHLMSTEEKADIRLIYLAMHNIVKHRGNFLREGQSLSAESAKPDEAVEEFLKALSMWCDSQGGEYGFVESAKIVEILAKDETNKSKSEQIAGLLQVSFGDSAADKKMKQAFAKAMVGLKAEFKNIFGELQVEKTTVSFAEDEAFEALSAACPDEGKELLEALQKVYASYILQGLLSYAPGRSISTNMVKKYEQYQNNLALLKCLVKEYRAECYDSFFRGKLYSDGSGYDPSKVDGYTKYNLKKLSYDDFAKEVKKLFAGTSAEADERFVSMVTAFEAEKFLRRLKTSDNGSIYYQLHLEEMRAIIENQGKHYPVLKKEADKLLSLVSFRIPYYVGPLTQRNARLDAHDKPRFAWSERKPGMESVAITPWNWEEVIDKHQSAENFIRRMTGICTYLQGEDVLPKSSLLYEEFCMLNELNGMRWTCDGDSEQRFDAEQRQGIINDLCHHTKSITYKKIQDWLKENQYAMFPHVCGGQGESGLESKMSSYIFFAKDVFGVDEIAKSDYPMIEEIILWNTLFEDRSILKDKLEEKYGPSGEGRLNETQIKKICKKRFTGWGRLSRKFLAGIKVATQTGEKTIMDILREGDPNSDTRRNRAMVLMEILHDDKLGFQEEIDGFNRAYFEQAGEALGINDLPGSPAVRRSLNQAIKIVNEIAHIAGKAPANIFIEVTREDDMGKKGKPTKRRYDSLKEGVEAFKKENPQLLQELKSIGPNDLDERITLYFMQGGKCMYSGKPIEFSHLPDGNKYEVDHIIPRSYVKDDSFENKALVLRAENQSKTDAMLIDPAVRKKMENHWKSLYEAKLIGEKKFNNLTRSTSINENRMCGFIARQLVETSQTVKFAQALLGVKYPDAKIVPVKASLSHDLREAAGLVKCREANDFHHAHDAYLACCLGLFIQKQHPGIYEHPIKYAKVMRDFVRAQSDLFNKSHKAPGSSGFIVGSFMQRKIDRDTGEIEWDATQEVEDIRKALNYRQCFITRMPVEDSGAFWGATIYSPRDSKKGTNLSLPLKKGLDPQIYGGYSNQEFAYFFIYEAKDKKNHTVFRFAEVPVYLAALVRRDKKALVGYACQLAESEGYKFVRIERAKLLKKQLMEINGERFLLTGKEEVRNATELAFSIEEVAFLQKHILTQQGKFCDNLNTDVCADDIMNRLLGESKKFAAKLLNQIKLEDLHENFVTLAEEEKAEILCRILLLINASRNMVDLTPIKGAGHAGQMKHTFSKELSDPKTDFYIIDQSVTGIFEKRTRVGL